MMISRHWRGLAKHAQADSYVKHLQDETFPAIAKIPGFVDASILKRSVDQGIEFLVVTCWKSMDAIEQFAGRAPEIAVVPTNVQEMMVEYDRFVGHYEVVGNRI
jgi:heme-degrading monooxygenase HmoA